MNRGELRCSGRVTIKQRRYATKSRERVRHEVDLLSIVAVSNHPFTLVLGMSTDK